MSSVISGFGCTGLFDANSYFVCRKRAWEKLRQFKVIVHSKKNYLIEKNDNITDVYSMIILCVYVYTYICICVFVKQTSHSFFMVSRTKYWVLCACFPLFYLGMFFQKIQVLIQYKENRSFKTYFMRLDLLVYSVNACWVPNIFEVLIECHLFCGSLYLWEQGWGQDLFIAQKLIEEYTIVMPWIMDF